MGKLKISYYSWRRKRYAKKDRQVYDKVTNEVLKTKKEEK
jgi:hypothetical protein